MTQQEIRKAIWSRRELIKTMRWEAFSKFEIALCIASVALLGILIAAILSCL